MRVTQAQYRLVLELVENSLTIDQACISVGVKRKDLYRSITATQKQELRMAKAIARPGKGNMRGRPTVSRSLTDSFLNYPEEDEN